MGLIQTPGRSGSLTETTGGGSDILVNGLDIPHDSTIFDTHIISPWIIMDHLLGHGLQGICLGWSISILEPRTAEGGDAGLGFIVFRSFPKVPALV